MANKKARVLQAFRYGEYSFECGQVIDAPAAVIDEMVGGGNVDDHKDAVAYSLKELGQEPIRITGQIKPKPKPKREDN